MRESSRPLHAATLAKARAGDASALEQLLRGVAGRLRRQASRQLGRKLRAKLDSSDILQHTYVHVLTSLPDFSGHTEAEFCSWVTRILERTIREQARYFEAACRSPEREQTADGGELAAAVPTPSAEVTLDEELVRLAAAMARLPRDQARVLMLHMDPRQTHERTARLLDRTPAATRALLARARASLLLELDRLARADG